MLPRIPLRPAGWQLAGAVLLTIALLPIEPALAQNAIQPGEAYVTRFSGTRPSRRRPGDRHQRHRRQHHRRARAAHAAARAALGRRAAKQAGDRRPGRPGVRRDARRRQPAQRLSHRDLGLRAAPRRQRLDARHVGSGRRPRHHLPARCLDRLRAAGVRADHAQRPAEQRRRARQHRLRPRQQAAVRLGSRDRDDPPHPRRRRRRPRLSTTTARRAEPISSTRRTASARACRRSRSIPIRARASTIAGAAFDYSPQCWNFAATGRRVWGLGVRRDVMHERDRGCSTRCGASPAFAQTGWNQASDDDKRNTVWSVRLAPNGGFDPPTSGASSSCRTSSTRRTDIARAGFSQPVSDISFSECGQRPVMLVAERGGIRNLGLGARECVRQSARGARAALRGRRQGQLAPGRPLRRRLLRPHQGRCALHAGELLGRHRLRPRLRRQHLGRRPGQAGSVRVDHGRQALLAARIRATCRAAGRPKPARRQPQQAAARSGGDGSEVHGIQGLAEGAFEELVPESAFAPTPRRRAPPPAAPTRPT